MSISQAYRSIGKRVFIVIDVPDTKYGLHLYAGDTGIIDTGAGEIGFAPDRYAGMLKFAHEGIPFVAYCVLEGKQAGEPEQMELFEVSV
jgi:hypothetical protein